ncbi:MAG: hypothetical protein ACO3RW_10375, partial [Burkholderiaceae bacterium]
MYPLGDGELPGGNTGVSALGFDGLMGCAIKSREVYCWGSGVLGDGAESSTSTEPVKVASGPDGFANSNVVDLYVGGARWGGISGGSGQTTCVIREEGASGAIGDVVYCWGDNYNLANASRLGLGAGSDSVVLTHAKVQPGNTGFSNSGVTAVGGSSYATCFVEGGVAYCAGLYTAGGTGLWNGSDWDNALVPEKLPATDGFLNNGSVTALTGGNQHV